MNKKRETSTQTRRVIKKEKNDDENVEKLSTLVGGGAARDGHLSENPNAVGEVYARAVNI